MTIGNIPLRKYIKFLKSVGCEHTTTKGGHYKFVKQGLTRPIILQSHVDPVPKHVIMSNNKTLGITNAAFLEIISNL